MGSDSILADKTFLSVVLSVLLIIYCYQKDVSGIKAAAYWGVFGINLLLFLVLYDLLSASKADVLYDWTKLNIISLDKNPTNIISCISCIILSFSFHTYTFSIYECLSEKNTKSMLITTGVGLFASMMIYLLFGCVGYILYVDQVDEYYILNRQHDSVLNYLENIAFVVNVVMSFPLTFFSLRHYFTFLVQILLTLLVEKFECLKKFRPEPEQEHEDPHKISAASESANNGDEDETEIQKNKNHKAKKDSFVNKLNKHKKGSLLELSISSKSF
jgi:amino acid permease